MNKLRVTSSVEAKVNYLYSIISGSLYYSLSPILHFYLLYYIYR